MIDLTFTGCGSGFNPKLGSTSAWFVPEPESLVIIDCGPGTLQAMLKTPAYRFASDVIILITHTHADHIGDLPTLIMHSWYSLKRKTRIITGPSNGNTIRTIVNACGVPTDAYKIEALNTIITHGLVVHFEITPHVEELSSYAIELKNKDDVVYWTGDTSSTHGVEKFMRMHDPDDASIFIDFSAHKNPVHVYYKDWEKVITGLWRHKTTAMHLDSIDASLLAESLGFKSALRLSNKQN